MVRLNQDSLPPQGPSPHLQSHFCTDGNLLTGPGDEGADGFGGHFQPSRASKRQSEFQSPSCPQISVRAAVSRWVPSLSRCILSLCLESLRTSSSDHPAHYFHGADLQRPAQASRGRPAVLFSQISCTISPSCQQRLKVPILLSASFLLEPAWGLRGRSHCGFHSIPRSPS